MSQLTSDLRYGVRNFLRRDPGDPATLANVGATALAVAGIACLLPAWRAARLNPLDGLRENP